MSFLYTHILPHKGRYSRRPSTEGYYLLPAGDIVGSSAYGSSPSSFPSSLGPVGWFPKSICSRELWNVSLAGCDRGCWVGCASSSGATSGDGHCCGWYAGCVDWCPVGKGPHEELRRRTPIPPLLNVGRNGGAGRVRVVSSPGFDGVGILEIPCTFSGRALSGRGLGWDRYAARNRVRVGLLD